MIIDARRISWRREHKTVLEDVTWQVKKGEQWCLVGLNGSGKTTLLRMINGYIWPTEGSLSVLGRAFGRTDLRELRKEIGWASSSLGERIRPEEFPLEIVLSGMFSSIGLYEETNEADRERASALLARLDCLSFAGRPFGTLSQGERQRVLIARALMDNPKLLILDEPCNGLDILARERLLAQIRQLASRPDAPAIIFVTHHVDEILPCFDHALFLREGTVYRSGLTEDLLKPEVVSDFYGEHVIVERHGDRLSLAVRG